MGQALGLLVERRAEAVAPGLAALRSHLLKAVDETVGDPRRQFRLARLDGDVDEVGIGGADHAGGLGKLRGGLLHRHLVAVREGLVAVEVEVAHTLLRKRLRAVYDGVIGPALSGAGGVTGGAWGR